MKKYKLGEFFTKEDFWKQPQILRFMDKYTFNKIVDPFAGYGDLLNHIKNKQKIGFDIDPKKKWKINDSLKKIPQISNSFIITNPPYLSKFSNKRKNINHKAFLESNKKDLYQIALDRIIESKTPGIAIVPETFIRSNYSKVNIYSITILIPNPFKDTETPVCIICFNPNKIYKKTRIYKNNKFINYLENIIDIKDEILKFKQEYEIKFNDILGNLALVAYDSWSGKKIHFLKSKELIYNREIKVSSRVVTKISVNNIKITKTIIEQLNEKLDEYRFKTNDVLLSPFKSNFKNQKDRRRRLDFLTARNIINNILNNI